MDFNCSSFTLFKKSSTLYDTFFSDSITEFSFTPLKGN